MTYEIISLEKKRTSTDKDYLRVALKDQEEKKIENVSIWGDFPGFEDMTEGTKLEGEVVEKNGFKNFKAPQTAAKRIGSTFMMEKKKTDIIESQDRKARNIKEAQDRSAWMWAKNNAIECMKLVPDPLVDDKDMINRIERIATAIYNLEPIEPFNN